MPLTAGCAQYQSITGKKSGDAEFHPSLFFFLTVDSLASTYFTIIAIWRRTTWYCMRQFEINHFLDAIERYRITELHVVPPIMLAMTKSAAIKSGKVDLSCVRATFSSAAPLGAEVTRQFEQMWPDGSMNVKQGFAMGEYVNPSYCHLASV